MRFINYILIFTLACFTPVFSQKGKAKQWKEEAKEDAFILSSKDYPYIDKFHKAVREKLAGNLSEAKKLFEECLKENKYDDAVYFALADIAHQQKEQSKALNYFEKAYEIDPGNITYLQKLAYLNYEKTDFDQAEVYFSKLCELEPRNLDFRYGYLNVLIYNRNYQKAISNLEIMEEQVGIIPDLAMMKADLYQELKNHQKAEETLLQLKEEYPNDMEVLQNIIVYYEQQNKKETAILLIEELVEKDPENGRAMYILANNYLALKEKDKFLTIAPKVIGNSNVELEDKLFIYEHLLKLKGTEDPLVFKTASKLFEEYPNNEDVLLNYGSLLVAKNQTKKALEILRSITKISVNDYDAWSKILLFESDYKDYHALFEDGLRAVELFPSFPVFYYLAAEGALYSGHPDEAEDLLAQGEIYIVDNLTEKARFNMRQGEIFFVQKEYKKGIIAFEKALSIKKDAIIKITYALALSEANIALEAADEMLGSIKEEEKTKDFYFARGMYYLRTEQYKKGIKEVNLGIETVLNKGELYDLLGDLYFKNQQTKKALETWEKAKTLESRNKNLDKKIKEEKLYEAIYF